ncbi:hypothetical protein E4U30_007955 [Claviceps sp. LM220 group G6]|nr:hypothetical protein E4U15_007301 [Claviceps sp. LM218 group G6]KAG6087122.1 hypothetical protein E4U31_000602 [Claviceps sp. LM219 group G6]KAG6090807.1 hypothetical protein E4U30_007955 [Claviceps sp. LM220 group G6]KAG6103769.1 hypothetical protein E4U14_006115 [Claviceps sp. LM454 group G7]
MDNCINKRQLKAFAKLLKETFLGHGGVCPKDPLIILDTPLDAYGNVERAIEWTHKEITEARGYTQLLFVVLGHKNSPYYARLKKSADCDFGILSQVVTSSFVTKTLNTEQDQIIVKRCT